MANFYPWIDTSNTNVMSANDFKNDSQRTTGFEAGQAASSKRVNSALRQANLFVAALANVILGNDTTLNLTSSLNAVQTKLASSHPFDIPIQQAGMGSSKSIVPKDVIAGENTIGSTVLASIVYGTSNKVETNLSACFGTANELISKTYNSPMFLFGSNLYNEATTHAKFVTGYYNTDCGDCVRETGAGTASARKTVEKLDKDGTLYINALALVIGNITDQTNLGNTEVLTPSYLQTLNKIARIYTSDWTTKNTGAGGYFSLDEGTYLINISKDTVSYDFGVVTLKKAGNYNCPYKALVNLASTSDPAAAWTYNVNGDFGILITGTTGRVANVIVRYKKIGETW